MNYQDEMNVKQAVGMMRGASAMSQEDAVSKALAANKKPSVVVEEYKQVERNIMHLTSVIESLKKELYPVLIPQPEFPKGSGEQTGVARSPLHHSLYETNCRLSNLIQEVEQLRSSLSI